MTRGIRIMQLLVHHMMMLWWIISSTAAAASLPSAPPIAKPNCPSYCGDVSIPYPFGIGPNTDCYFNEWFQIDCSKSTNNSKPFLSRTQMEVLNISIDGNLWVNNPVTFFSCKGKKTRQAPNLMGSPFLYSQTNNTFTAVSCGFRVTMSSEEKVIGSCITACDESTDSRRCDLGINCCQLGSLPVHLSAFSAEIKSISKNSSDYCKYAFLVDQEWFMNNISSDFRAIESQGMDKVPVVLEWNISFDSNNTSLLKSFERFNGSRIDPFSGGRKFDDPAPICEIQNASTSSTYNQSISLQCSCPRGFEGNPYLLRHCQDIDECDLNLCKDPDRFGFGMNYSGSSICDNFVGGYKCYSKITGALCDYRGAGCRCMYKPATSLFNRIKNILLDPWGLLLEMLT